ncbi:MAG: hypothetical protein H0V89_14745 [Deltaproteobacteria bacterium]|nr:hypothetical protein [Deltaproteobacteria bacterium]
MAWWALLLACTKGGPAEDAPADTAPPSDTDVPVPPDPPDAAAPGIAEALGDCGGLQEDPGPYPNQMQPGEDLGRVLLTDPDAVCNDGTPAALYVRAATDPRHENDWVFHLQGGSDCVSYEDCATRWCGGEFYDASKMSSAWTPTTIAGVGIHSVSETNQLAGWNHVFFYYCSSDLWQGRSLATLTSLDSTATYGLHRQGHTILEAGLALADAGLVSEDGLQVLPALTAASTVIFTGTSAGSIGAQASLDWVAERLAPARVVGIFDAAVAPDPRFLEPTLAVTVEAESEARSQARDLADAVPGFGDASCEAALPDDRHWECRSSSYLPYQWVTTPFLARMDLHDPPTGDIYVALGATQDEFGEAVAASLASIAERTVDGGEHPGAFGPSCAEHLGLEIEAQFLQRPVDGVTLHAATLAMLARMPVTVIDPDGTLSVCPQ